MPSTVIPSPIFHPLESVKLGRLITNIDQPHESYHEPQIRPQPPMVAEFSLDVQNRRESKMSFASVLSKVLSVRFSKQIQESIQVVSDRGTSYSLDNSEAWLDEAVSLSETRTWIERAALRGRTIYLIVGIQTLTNPCIRLAVASGRQSEAGLDISQALSAAADGALSVFLQAEVATKGQFTHHNNTEHCVKAPGERVCAIQYRRLKYGWLSHRSPERMYLSKTRQWSCIEGHMREISSHGDEEEDVDEEDVIVVDFDSDELQGN
ncbi:hypothetical protein M441DRAFT_62780 [Trichoderma asperellum CBS 433.97]|uniref:Uncharacterized protein n=1 Tax=Trichoderma asperellum (strain ATCC 204424 / CBS 433.97 / NBRC 101777) TaxID=1042311 RepID=A0A2T3YSE4_TRIA4|nr:hypothetical protein M441DRAFT_62780 [Trichoderma asperellum CBS 433.97]PTB35490.1 hypothetical protein M441DRAFT_62780 [Trichoderma asperellum CBS 433.97]